MPSSSEAMTASSRTSQNRRRRWSISAVSSVSPSAVGRQIYRFRTSLQGCQLVVAPMMPLPSPKETIPYRVCSREMVYERLDNVAEHGLSLAVFPDQLLDRVAMFVHEQSEYVLPDFGLK